MDTVFSVFADLANVQSEGEQGSGNEDRAPLVSTKVTLHSTLTRGETKKTGWHFVRGRKALQSAAEVNLHLHAPADPDPRIPRLSTSLQSLCDFSTPISSATPAASSLRQRDMTWRHDAVHFQACHPAVPQ